MPPASCTTTSLPADWARASCWALAGVATGWSGVPGLASLPAGDTAMVTVAAWAGGVASAVTTKAVASAAATDLVRGGMVGTSQGMGLGVSNGVRAEGGWVRRPSRTVAERGSRTSSRGPSTRVEADVTRGSECP